MRPLTNPCVGCRIKIRIEKEKEKEKDTFDSVGREESQVLGLERVVVGELGVAGLRFRLAGERRVVHLEAARLDDADVGRDTVAEFHLDDVSDADLLGLHRLLEALAHHHGVLRHHVLERLHDFVTFALLVVGEDARHHHHGRQHRTKVQLNATTTIHSFVSHAIKYSFIPFKKQGYLEVAEPRSTTLYLIIITIH